MAKYEEYMPTGHYDVDATIALTVMQGEALRSDDASIGAEAIQATVRNLLISEGVDETWLWLDAEFARVTHDYQQFLNQTEE